MESIAPSVTTVDEKTKPWWREPWGSILLAWLASFGVGLISAQLAKSQGNWDQGFAWERAMLLRIHTPLPKAVDTLMLVFPWFGTNISLIPAVIVVCWWLWVKKRAPRYAVRLGVVQLGSYLLNPSLKALFDRKRPTMFERRGWYGWSSYPSGHAIASVSVLITFAIIIHRLTGKTWIYYVVFPIMLASLYSRMYLGVHWPTDVFAGMIVGLAWLFTTMYVFRDVDQGDANAPVMPPERTLIDERNQPR